MACESLQGVNRQGFVRSENENKIKPKFVPTKTFFDTGIQQVATVACCSASSGRGTSSSCADCGQ